jgi:hypothetical protein
MNRFATTSQGCCQGGLRPALDGFDENDLAKTNIAITRRANGSAMLNTALVHANPQQPSRQGTGYALEPRPTNAS